MQCQQQQQSVSSLTLKPNTDRMSIRLKLSVTALLPCNHHLWRIAAALLLCCPAVCNCCCRRCCFWRSMAACSRGNTACQAMPECRRTCQTFLEPKAVSGMHVAVQAHHSLPQQLSLQAIVCCSTPQQGSCSWQQLHKSDIHFLKYIHCSS